MIVLGLDIGTTTLAGVALELSADGGPARLVQTASEPGGAAVMRPGSPLDEQQPELVLAAAERLIARLSAGAPEPPAAIGLTGQMHGIVYTDAAGAACSPLYTWQHRSGLAPASEADAAGSPDAGGETLAARLSRLSGYPLATGYGVVTHAALERADAVPREAVAMGTIADYVAMRLCGRRMPVLEPSQAAGLGGYDLDAGAYDRAALARAGIGTALLPPVSAAPEPIGYTPGGAAVCAAIGDNQASVLGALRELETELLLNIGTGSQLSMYAARPLRVPGLETRPFPGGGCLLVGAALAGGQAYALLERFLRGVVEELGSGRDAGASVLPEGALYARMEDLLDREERAGRAAAGTVPDTQLRVHTQFYGTRQDPHARGAVAGIGPDNWTPGQLITGVLDGIADELHGYWEALPPAVRGRVSTLAGAGGALRRSRHLALACARRFGLPLRRPALAEEAAVGAALHAAVCVGAIDGYAAAGGRLPDGESEEREIRG
ncbi:hypothetical protein IDH44_06355 [Paenibacillus sp. IB182496]|uniref:Sedoheptulokinase n=1 Tax=Paenibacillus sabuli TaxID=2772509 RepID=A0A927BR94_9BACL|nr:FGGY family carbohydrate kinase [Paenibacillus sabuli]MBD2844807.1 hypothetical protein [Paenibacillus sabuli]